MKRSPPNSPERDTKPDISIPSSPATPKKPRKLPNSKDMKSPSPRKTNEHVGEWTAEKREILITTVLTAGWAATDTAALAEKLGVSKVQLNNAMQAGRTGNCRDKAIKAVKGG